MVADAAVLDRFMSKIVWNGEDGECWDWHGYVRASGYGEFWLRGLKQYAHRVAYELFVGLIPGGLHLDHLCRNRRCVNPAHLEPVTMAENLRRGAPNASQPRTHCKLGHPLTADNVYRFAKGGKTCKRCAIRRSREWRKRQHA